MTTVSVLVPTYNRPALLAEALASIQRSTMPARDYEVVVVNDGGEDVSAVAQRYGAAYLTIKHGGQGAACNAGLAATTGHYVTVAHDDDLVLPAKLSALAAALDAADDGVAAAYGLPRYTDAASNERPCRPELERFQRRYPRLTWAEIEGGSGLWVHGTGPMYRRAWLNRIGGWDDELETAEEYDLHLRLLHAGGAFIPVRAAVVTYRAGGKSTHYRVRNRRDKAMARIYGRLKVDRAEYNARLVAP